MKLAVIIGGLAFILSVIGTMFFTGTLNRDVEQLSNDEVAQTNEEVNKDESRQPPKATEPQKTNEKNIAYVDSEKDNEQIEPDNLELAYRDSEIDRKDDSKDTKETDAKYEQLAKVYGSMKAENVAIVMCELEPKLTEKILSKMNDRVAGKIMSAIADKDPSYAAQVSKLLAGDKI